MRVGLIARGENRGLGILTREWARHMAPAATLLMLPAHDLPIHAEWFPPTTAVTALDSERRVVDEERVREWLRGLDVVYSAETFYDWRICDWAREAGVRTVCHLMPEYWPHGRHLLPAPDAWWAPTRWRLNHLPESTRVVPVPVALDRFTVHEPRTMDGPPRWLHVAGAPAAADRNGTKPFLASLALLIQAHHVTVRHQTARSVNPRLGQQTSFAWVGEAPEYWELYDGADALVLPRRYGGLSLPALEAMAAGLALVMTGCEPQRSEWPIVPLHAVPQGVLRLHATSLALMTTTPRLIARTLDRLAKDRAELAAAQVAARAFAEAHSWEALRPQIEAELERACR